MGIVDFKDTEIKKQIISTGGDQDYPTVCARLSSRADKLRIDHFAAAEGVSTSKLIKQALELREMFAGVHHYKLMHYAKDVKALLDDSADIVVVNQ